MKYGVYLGSIVKVLEETEKTALIQEDGETYHTAKHLITEVTEENYQAAEKELTAAKAEVRQTVERMGKLYAEFHRKHNALSSLLMEARGKEMALVNRLLRQSQERSECHESTFCCRFPESRGRAEEN